MIKNKTYHSTVDIFSYGVMLYRMLCGQVNFFFADFDFFFWKRRTLFFFFFLLPLMLPLFFWVSRASLFCSFPQFLLSFWSHHHSLYFFSHQCIETIQRQKCTRFGQGRCRAKSDVFTRIVFETSDCSIDRGMYEFFFVFSCLDVCLFVSFFGVCLGVCLIFVWHVLSPRKLHNSTSMLSQSFFFFIFHSLCDSYFKNGPRIVSVVVKRAWRKSKNIRFLKVLIGVYWKPAISTRLLYPMYVVLFVFFSWLLCFCTIVDFCPFRVLGTFSCIFTLSILLLASHIGFSRRLVVQLLTRTLLIVLCLFLLMFVLSLDACTLL